MLRTLMEQDITFQKPSFLVSADVAEISRRHILKRVDLTWHSLPKLFAYQVQKQILETKRFMWGHLRNSAKYRL